MYTIVASKWAHGYELRISKHVGVTQSHTLDDAEMMARDYIETITDAKVPADAVFEIVLDGDA
jgi:hypothetical protein